MKEKYYTFDGETLVSLGECENFDEACAVETAIMNQGEMSFFIAREKDWRKYIANMSEVLNNN